MQRAKSDKSGAEVPHKHKNRIDRRHGQAPSFYNRGVRLEAAYGIDKRTTPPRSFHTRRLWPKRKVSGLAMVCFSGLMR